jgi:hypothetical protein
VRERIEYRFRVPSAAVFTLYSYSKALDYPFRVPTVGSISSPEKCIMQKKRFFVTSNLGYMHGVLNVDEIKKLIVQFGCTL